MIYLQNSNRFAFKIIDLHYSLTKAQYFKGYYNYHEHLHLSLQDHHYRRSQGVGKSCLLKQFLEHRFKANTETTIGVEFGSKIIDLGQHRIKMQIWDTAGQQVFKSITRSYYRGSVAAILTYDITSRQSFKDTAKWLEQTRNYANEKITLLLIGNKSDLQQRREVTTQEGLAFAESNKMIFMECSAKDHELTSEAFLRLAKEVMRKIEHNEIDPKNQQHGIKLGNMGKAKKKQPSIFCCF